MDYFHTRLFSALLSQLSKISAQCEEWRALCRGDLLFKRYAQSQAVRDTSQPTTKIDNCSELYSLYFIESLQQAQEGMERDEK